MRPRVYCGWFFENISAVLTGIQKAQKRMNVARQNIVRAVKIMQKGHSEMWIMEVDVSEMCVALTKLSQKKIPGKVEDY